MYMERDQYCSILCQHAVEEILKFYSLDHVILIISIQFAVLLYDIAPNCSLKIYSVDFIPLYKSTYILRREYAI